MLNTVAAAALALASIIPSNSVEASDDVPDYITIDVVTVNGSGCPAGTAAVASADDRTAFTVTYSDYLAQAGAGTSPTDFRKNCQLNIRVSYPQGFTYGIAQADYRGFAHLQHGATGTEKGNYYFSGSSQTASRTHNFYGPHSDNWQATDKSEVSAIVYAPCGERRNLNINTELRVNTGGSKNATSFMTMDSTDSSVSTKYHFSWKRC
ncbi:DUF4360 domain-containing protein [Lentzea tibetensis]|uniref:DUF4360 domain-containing protein n=1 Tax=Lentzea tibetensis TaxID=2591470 RepID=A0A563ETW2_9PSEU|nr:DUF4360 domain-containing protein [Lentzea tibetensis]TWP51022.1 DUF4360 domain-containing protein [Lentzea tibetensis]